MSRTILSIALAMTMALAVTVTSGAAAAPAAAAQPAPTREATLPLEEILRLYRETERAAEKPEPPPPPVRAAIHRLELAGRLLDGAVDLTARFEVVVLDDAAWASVPLLAHGERTHLSALPAVDNGFFVVDDGYLRFVTRHKGTYRFVVSLLEQAEIDGRGRTVRLGYDHAALALCRVSFDKGLFRLRNDLAIERSEGVMLFPENRTFTIAWDRTAEAPEAKKSQAPPPSIESIVPVAHASAVSTLEGRRVVRLRYQLRFAGSPSVEIGVPEGFTVERAYLNGVGVPAEVDAERSTLIVEVTPVREGDQSAVLELVLVGSGSGYLLSGALELRLPRLSWPVNQLFLDVHLPEVFNYDWSGGSLSPVESTPAVSYAYELPLPGKKLSFQQHLISSTAPDVTLDYTVDLEGQFYRP